MNRPAFTWNPTWMLAPRLVALALVAFVGGVTAGIAGL